MLPPKKEEKLVDLYLSGIKIFIIIVLSAPLILASILKPQQASKLEELSIERASMTLCAEGNEYPIDVELARTSKEQARGLMFRKHLDEYSGMLFHYPDVMKRSFWMKNTLIPLDIAFLDNDGVIVDIQTMEPCTTEECVVYTSSLPARAALEMNAGFFEQNNILPGAVLSDGCNG